VIPRAAITAWRSIVPWPDDNQVEQDLVLSRALVEIFHEPVIAEHVLLRGGTAFQKLILESPVRYSEDIDLVQRKVGPSGEMLDAIRGRLDSWLGSPRRDRAPGSVTITYRFESEVQPVRSLRLKIEINTNENFAVFEPERRRFAVDSTVKASPHRRRPSMPGKPGGRSRASHSRRRSGAPPVRLFAMLVAVIVEPI
jgi:hypothetical protein